MSPYTPDSNTMFPSPVGAPIEVIVRSKSTTSFSMLDDFDTLTIDGVEITGAALKNLMRTAQEPNRWFGYERTRPAGSYRDTILIHTIVDAPR